MLQRSFTNRHIGPRDNDLVDMLSVIGEPSIDQLIYKTIPEDIRLESFDKVGPGLQERDYLSKLGDLAEKNKVFRNYIGLGYYNTVVPSVIRRNVLENPGWYTAYTPYQAEIAQGRLEALLNFQTMVSDLTGMELANASLLDEATAAAEAMTLLYNARSREQLKAGVNKYFVSQDMFPQVIDLLKTRSEPIGIELVIGKVDEVELSEDFFGAAIQYPDLTGGLPAYKEWVNYARKHGVKVAVGTDLMALVMVEAPGRWGADVVYGNSQRFGVPLGYGGPHAAFFATLKEYKRYMPGRIIGVSKDSRGRNSLRMALQTREQHIKRDRATSNICTAQALLAVMASMYAVYHGPEGLREIASSIHEKTARLAGTLTVAGIQLVNDHAFDTLTFTPLESVEKIRERALAQGINLRYNDDGTISVSLDETTRENDLNDLALLLTGNLANSEATSLLPSDQFRKTSFLEHDVFSSYHTETEMMRYLKRLENRDMSLTHSMIPLGSCTMKLNAATQLLPLTWIKFSDIHPFAPTDQAEGYLQIFKELDEKLSYITGFAKVSLQPNSGAQGEYSGLMVIRAYHQSRGEGHRNIALIPSSAHGTNPASAVMAGMKVVVVNCDEHGNIDVDDLREKAEKHSNDLAALMITYPSTHGVFEARVKEVTSIIHEHGGQVYMDGANMNAQVGLTNPGKIGADVCHLNLHKTFAIPHGGGGPGMGPIGVAEHLVPFLPGNVLVKTGGEQAISGISATPFGSGLILLISYGYIEMLGSEGLQRSTEVAILNANYMKARLETYYPILYTGEKGTVAHEMILDCREFKKTAGIEVEDIAKRLMDYGFHAPTVSFPVAGTLMVEPTESESLAEIDRFCEAMIAIRREIARIEDGIVPKDNNPLKHAPHTADVLLTENWDRPYSREEAAYPAPYVREAKFWPSVGRVDNAFGDRNLICTCPPMEMYQEPVV